MAHTPGAEKIPFRRSIQLKFALTYIIIIAAVLILLNTYPVLVSQDLVFRSKTSLLQSQASVIADTIARTESLTSEAVRDYVEPLGYTGQFRVLVTDEFGLILYDSDELRFTEGRYAMLSEVVTALKGYDVATCSYQDGGPAVSTSMSGTPTRAACSPTSRTTCAPSPW